jgi:hypothetical protein
MLQLAAWPSGHLHKRYPTSAHSWNSSAHWLAPDLAAKDVGLRHASMIHEYACNKWISDLLVATSQPAPPETANITSGRHSKLCSRLENSSAVSLLCQPVMTEGLPAAKSLQERTLGATGRLQGRTSGPQGRTRAAAIKNTEPRQPDSHYDESFAGIQQACPATDKRPF